MGTVSFAISNINNPIRYFTNVTIGKIPVSVYNFSEEAKKREFVIIMIILFCKLMVWYEYSTLYPIPRHNK